MSRYMSISSVLVVFAGLGCQGVDSRGNEAPAGDADTDSDADGDGDSDSDTGSDTDTGTQAVDLSYIWISNSAEGTLSKVDTQQAAEVARYRTCEYAYCDPSRTSVNLHGDMVVTNRNPTGDGWETVPSSVTKFVASLEDCVDYNDNGQIDTSTGPTDVRPWAEDECLIWSTDLPGGTGARATAWDGQEDPETGLGGHVWIGMCDWSGTGQVVYKLDGDTGAIVGSVDTPAGCCYGGAMDGNHGFWIYDSSNVQLVRVDTEDLTVTTRSISCGYGITVDSQGRVWTGGSGSWSNCVSRYTPSTDQEDVVEIGSATFPRGIAVGVDKSDGFVWSADTSGTLFKIDEETMAIAGSYPVGDYDMIGVAVDFEGYVWTVSQSGNAAYKFDPEAETHVTVPIGNGPYTYSDMTGVQLKNVISPE